MEDTTRNLEFSSRPVSSRSFWFSYLLLSTFYILRYNKGMKHQPILFIILAVLIVGISIGLFVVRDPEYTQVVSADGALTIEGLTREAQDIQIDVVGDYIYNISPSASAFIEPLTLTFNVAQAQFDFDIAVYKYNEDILMWEAISGAIDASAQEIVINQNVLGTYTIKEYADIDAPDFVNTYGDILLLSPDSTVGYEIALGFIAADGSVIRISENTELGGCGGIVEHGSGVEMSQLERSARVYVGDVEQQVEFLIVARWFVNGEEGCVDNQSLESSSQRDII